MKRLALLFIGLIACAPTAAAPAPSNRDTVEISIKNTMFGKQVFVDYQVSTPSSQVITSAAGTTAALELQGSAIKKARGICEQNGEIAMLITSSVKQDKGEISGRAVVVCLKKETQENQEKQEK